MRGLKLKIASAPIGAWKRTYSTFRKLWPTDRPIDGPTDGLRSPISWSLIVFDKICISYITASYMYVLHMYICIYMLFKRHLELRTRNFTYLQRPLIDLNLLTYRMVQTCSLKGLCKFNYWQDLSNNSKSLLIFQSKSSATIVYLDRKMNGNLRNMFSISFQGTSLIDGSSGDIYMGFGLRI